MSAGLNGEVNKQNDRYLLEAHAQWSQKVIDWAGVLENDIVGPLLIEESFQYND